jgi:hypothetical protein
MKGFLGTRSVLSVIITVMIAASIIMLLTDTFSPLKALAASSQTTSTLSIPATQAWTDTGIDLAVGSSVSITASGTIYIAGSDPGKTPDGSPDCSAPSSFVAPGLHCWSLIGNIANGTPFQVGSSTEFSATVAGRLYLGVNDEVFGDNSGNWTATITIGTPSPTPNPTWLYDAGSYAGKSGFVSIDTSGQYNEPNNKKYVNYCGPAASQELISAWKSKVPNLEKLANEENTNRKSNGTLMTDMVVPINNAIGQTYYTTSTAGFQGAFSDMIGRDILDNHHPLITGIQTRDDKGHQLNGWDKISAAHIITIYGFDFTSPSVGYIYYYETAGPIAGTTATGQNHMDYATFWTLVQFNTDANIQLHGQ